MNKNIESEEQRTQGEDARAEDQEDTPDNIYQLNGDEELGLETLLEREREKVNDLTDQVQRERAELINYRRRKEQDQERERARAVESVLLKILPVADDFQRAIKTLPPDTENNSWAEGFKLIESNLWRSLESFGVTAMESVGKPFDPTRHEAVMFDESTTGEHMVVEEFQRGYLINDRVLRPAMVKVGSITTDGSTTETND